MAKPTLTVQLMHARRRIAELESMVLSIDEIRSEQSVHLAELNDRIEELERLVEVHKAEAHNLRLKQRGNSAIKTVAHTPWVRPAHMEAARQQAMSTGCVVKL